MKTSPLDDRGVVADMRRTIESLRRRLALLEGAQKNKDACAHLISATRAATKADALLRECRKYIALRFGADEADLVAHIDDYLAQPAPGWSTEPPTEPGFYWWRKDAQSKPEIVPLDETDGRLSFVHIDTGNLCGVCGYEWLGPLTPEQFQPAAMESTAGEGEDDVHKLLTDAGVKLSDVAGGACSLTARIGYLVEEPDTEIGDADNSGS